MDGPCKGLRASLQVFLSANVFPRLPKGAPDITGAEEAAKLLPSSSKVNLLKYLHILGLPQA